MPKPSSICLSSVVPTSIRWLWTHRIPQGMLTILEGNPSEGKSLMLADIMARVTTRQAMPFDVVAPSARRRQSVLILNQEDHISAVIRHRMEAAGADLGHVHVKVKTKGGKPLLIPDDLPEIEQEAKRVEARLIVIDPIQDFLSFSLSNNLKIRSVIAELDELAQRLDAAFIVVRHLAKNSGRDSRHKGLGGMSMIGRARFAFRVEVLRGHAQADPDRVLTCIKTNAGMKPLDVHFRLPMAHTLTPRVDWIEEIQPPPVIVAARLPTEVERARDFLIDLLAGGPRPSLEVFEAGESQHLSERTIRRAQGGAGVEAVRHGNGWFWLFPEHRDRLVTLGNEDGGDNGDGGQGGQDGQRSEARDGASARVVEIQPSASNISALDV